MFFCRSIVCVFVRHSIINQVIGAHRVSSRKKFANPNLSSRRPLNVIGSMMHRLIAGMYNGFTEFLYLSPEMFSIYLRQAFSPMPNISWATNVYADSIHTPSGLLCVIIRYTAGDIPRHMVRGHLVWFSPHLYSMLFPRATPARNAITPIVPCANPTSCKVHPSPPSCGCVRRNTVRL